MSRLRFTDGDKWRDSWFRKLPPWGKLLWVYLTDNCDICGFYEVDCEVCEMMLGLPVPWDEVPATFAGRVRILEPGKWLLPKYVGFQFRGKFNPTSDRYAKGVVLQLSRKGLSLADLVFSDSDKGVGGVQVGASRPLQCQDTPLCRGNVDVEVDVPTPIAIPAPAPAQPSAKPSREVLAKLLRRYGLAATQQAQIEWQDLMTGIGGCRSADEALEGVPWILNLAEKRGVEIKYARDASALAKLWATHLAHRQPQPAEESP